MRVLLCVAILLYAASIQADGCIQIDAPDLSFDDEGVGAATVQWQANLRNRCRKTFDADLTIQLLNENAETVYEFVEKTTLGMEERLNINRNIYVPSRIVEQVNDFTVHIEERERQH